MGVYRVWGVGTASVVRGMAERGYEGGEDRLWKEMDMRRMSVIVAGAMVVAGLGSGVAAAEAGAPAPGVGEQAGTAVVGGPCPPVGWPVVLGLGEMIKPVLPAPGWVGG